jgi:hypothetical protein
MVKEWLAEAETQVSFSGNIFANSKRKLKWKGKIIIKNIEDLEQNE